MALLPARNILDGTALPVTSLMKTSLGSLRDYLADLLGTDSSNKAAARIALGAAESGANSSITSLSAVTSINGGQLAGMRNRIINGNFSINQRSVSGVVTLAAGAYGHDRWKAGASGCTYTFSTTANVTTLTITAGSLIQVIEGLNLESGTFALSWTGTATGKIGAGSYSASGVTGAITGGTNTNIEFSTGAVSKVQLEFGSVATPFEQRPYGMELMLCQRYYEIGACKAGMGGATTVSTSVLYAVEKRATPSLTYYTSPQGAATFTPAGLDWTNSRGFSPYITGNTLNFAFAAAAEL